MTIKVMIVDDSPLVRQVIHDLLAPCHDIKVIAAMPDPILAMAKIRINWPDVIVLDIEMPRMDGITFLRQIMAIRPTPVVICSSLAGQGGRVAMDALAAGAISVIAKPALGIRDFLQDSSEDLISAIRAAAQAKLSRMSPHFSVDINKSLGPDSRSMKVALEKKNLTTDVRLREPAYIDSLPPVTEKIIAIGASTGGPQALEQVLMHVSQQCPGLVIVQHMPEKFTSNFAKRLNTVSQIDVKEAEHLDLIVPGRALIAPGGTHLVIKREATQYYVEVVDGPPVNRHKPSVDVLFQSLAKAAGKNAVGIILTGMGDDGARGMKELFDCGAATYAQDEESCTVFGMPKEALLWGGVGDIISLKDISSLIDRYGH